MNRIVGFTGTREGMSEHQKRRLEVILLAMITDGAIVDFHHGDCVGADADAHEIARRVGCRITIHPPIKATQRAFCGGESVIHSPKEYLERDRFIVDSCTVLIAAPKSDKEERRSGTWYTIRYAKKNKKYVIQLPREPKTI
jgi:hypothetical protein